jgi:hypothetical protein
MFALSRVAPLARTRLTILSASFVTSAARNRSGPLTDIVTFPQFIDKVNTSSDNPAHQPATIPSFRVLDGEGNVLPEVQGQWREQVDAVNLDSISILLSSSLYITITHSHPQLSQEEATRMYEAMLFLPALDNILYNSQRQGRISFYMSACLKGFPSILRSDATHSTRTHYGEEAAVIGSAAAWNGTDEIFAQYRGRDQLCYILSKDALFIDTLQRPESSCIAVIRESDPSTLPSVSSQCSSKLYNCQARVAHGSVFLKPERHGHQGSADASPLR